MQTPALRPLGAGELLDRAVTLFVRQFVPIVLVLAVVSVPVLVVQALTVPDPTNAFDLLAGLGGKRSTQTLQQINATNFANMRIALLSGVLRVLQWSALVAVIAAAYAGANVTLAQAYRIGLRRWLAQIGVGLMYLVIGCVLSIPWLVGYVILVVFVAFMAQSRVAGIAIGAAIVGALLVIVLAVATLAWIFIAYELATVAVVTERLSPVAATSAGLRRAFSTPTRWRSLAAGLVALTVNGVATVPLLAVGMLVASVTHLPFLYWGVAGVGELLVQGLLAAFVVVYAVDVRVRREGLDLMPVPPADDASFGPAPA